MNPQEPQTQFDHWLGHHVAILHHVAHAFASGDDWNDLMQELLMALWKAVPAFRGDSAPSTFIYRVAHNTALTWQRGRRNYQRRLEAFEIESALGRTTAPASANTARLDELYRAIRCLPEVDRSLILLSLDGVPYREMAEIHGISESSAGVRLHRAKQQLALLLKGTLS